MAPPSPLALKVGLSHPKHTDTYAYAVKQLHGVLRSTVYNLPTHVGNNLARLAAFTAQDVGDELAERVAARATRPERMHALVGEVRRQGRQVADAAAQRMGTRLATDGHRLQPYLHGPRPQGHADLRVCVEQLGMYTAAAYHEAHRAGRRYITRVLETVHNHVANHPVDAAEPARRVSRLAKRLARALQHHVPRPAVTSMPPSDQQA